MVCDNIDHYEIVLANGSIVETSADKHSDLWRALKGGTGNFGIVTRVTTKTFEAGDIWGGHAFWPWWSTSRLLDAFYDFNKAENFDPHAGGVILSLIYVRDVRLWLSAGGLTYTKPEKWPPVFDVFRSIWRFWDTIKIQPLLAVTEELERLAPIGLRQFQATATIKNDIQSLHDFKRIYVEKIEEVKHISGGVWSLVFQPLSAAVTRKGSPNVLGLETRHANDTLIIALISTQWRYGEDDQLVQRVCQEIIDLGAENARAKGAADPYIYLNYAATGQDVFAGYNPTNKKFLQSVSKKYDPDGFFQHAKPGGFKLDLY